MYSRVSIKAAQALHRGKSYQSVNTRVADGVMWVNGAKVAWYDAGDTELRITLGATTPPEVLIDRLGAVLIVFGIALYFHKMRGEWTLLSSRLSYTEVFLRPGTTAVFNIAGAYFAGYRSNIME